MPVLPAVASTTSPPGLSSPRFSASRIIWRAGRSLTEPPGFMNSALPRMVQPVASDARLSLMSGVSPIVSMISSRMGILVSPGIKAAEPRGPPPAGQGRLLQQPRGLLHDLGRRGVDVLHERLDRLAGDR